jgi:hypothetical protein
MGVSALAEDPRVPRAAYVSTEAIGGAEGGLIGGLMYVGAAAAAGAIVVSGGTLAAGITAAVLAGGAGAWPNVSAITMRIICKSRWIVEACYYGCGLGMLRTKGAPSKFSESIREATSTSTHCRRFSGRD